jgi:hypothetical protein
VQGIAEELLSAAARSGSLARAKDAHEQAICEEPYAAAASRRVTVQVVR